MRTIRLGLGVLFSLSMSISFASASEPAQLPVMPGLLPEPLKVGADMWYLGPGPGNPSDVKVRLNLNAADTVNADQLWSGGGLGLNLNGAGVTVGVWDAGAVRAAHQEFGGRVTVVDAVALDDHATHVAGTIGAAGVNAAARGMANAVNIRSRDWNSDNTELAADANLIQISNHSYSQARGWSVRNFGFGNEDWWNADRSRYTRDPNFGKYDQIARDFDTVLNQNQNLLSVWAAGNDRNDAFQNLNGSNPNPNFTNTYVTYLSAGSSGPGYYRVSATSLPPPPGDGQYDNLSNGGQTAKNTLVVGAINDITADPYNNGHVSMSAFSSWGPTDDGRLGVDIVANGVGLTSTTSTSNTAYASFSGTSMASPSVAGTMALLHQHYKNEKGGATPKAATMKGLTIHTAFDAGNVGPDYTYGWGVLDAAKAAQFVTATEAATPSDFIFENGYSGSQWSLSLVSDGSGPLKATLVWQDLPGVALNSALATAVLNDSTPALVNDLDIWIMDAIGNTYYPWNLDPNNPANPAFRTSLNHRDNVEQVLIDSPLAGLYTIYIGHTGSSFTQNYSLLISGAMIPEPAGALLGLLIVLGLSLRRRRVA